MIELPTESEPVRIIEGDCLEWLPRLPAGCVDAVVTDPPYNVGFKYNGDESGDCKDDYEGWCREWFSHLKRVCAGTILISCGIENLGVWHRIQQPRWVMCWWKPAAMGRCAVGFNNWEPVLVYGKHLKNICDVFEAQIRPDPALFGHPCPKPLMWARKQLRMMPSASKILDPFSGSGTTLVAAIAERRTAIGIERDPQYAAIARRRVEAAMCRDGLLAGV